MLMKTALSFFLFSAVTLATPVADSQISERATAVQTFKNTRWTYQDFGSTTACGTNNANTDFVSFLANISDATTELGLGYLSQVVALAPQQYGSGYPGPECFHRVTLYYQGKVVNATVADQSFAVPDGGLDLSPGLFSVFAPLGDGIIYGDWELY